MIRDRGTKKWTAMMLPEHVSMLKVAWTNYDKTTKPNLDEYQLQEIDEKINRAVEYRLPVIFELWYDGFSQDLEGVIKKVDHINNLVWISELNGDLHKIKYKSIISVEFVD